MRTKHRAAALLEQGLARDRADAHRDARALAIELARGVPSARFDPMRAGVVRRSGERVSRQVPLWLRVQQDGRWADASWADVLETDLRLLCRMGSGRLTSLWWNGVVGLQVDLAAEHMVLDFGDGQPVNLSGAHVGSAAIMGIASLHGMEAMISHPALASLRIGARAKADLRPHKSVVT